MTSSTKKTTSKSISVKAASSPKLPPNPFVHEILDLASKQRSKAKKAEILQEYSNDASEDSLYLEL